MKRLSVIALWLLAALVSAAWAQDPLIEHIEKKQWHEIPPLFMDSSYQILQSYFDPVVTIRFISLKSNKIVYRAKFRDYAEVGTIAFETIDGHYHKLRLESPISPIEFIDNFRAYPLENMTLQIGEAQVHFIKGILYRAEPANHPLIFNGVWEFRITPSDKEECETLRLLQGSPTFAKFSSWGLFILQDREFLKKISSAAAIQPAEKPEFQEAFRIYQRYFGIQIKEFSEYWYLPFSGSDNLVIFERDKDSQYLYNYNDQSTPDTLLRISKGEKLLLSYNSVRELKISLQPRDNLEELRLRLFIQPAKEFLSGTAQMWFKKPLAFRILNLDSGLKIRGNLDLDSEGINLLRKEEAYYILGPETAKMSFYYSGAIKSSEDYSDLVGVRSRYMIQETEKARLDKFYLLTRDQDFYPNPGASFFKSSLSILLPRKMNCLASGQLMEKKEMTAQNQFRFESPGTKGVSLVCGDFKEVQRIPSTTPIVLWSAAKKHIRILQLKELEQFMNFLCTTFGPLDVPQVNLLVRSFFQDGGVSYQGFIVLNLNLGNIYSLVTDNPMILTGERSDYAAHELAHQWWGGLVSWDTYRDEWITEGLAQFATLLYLKNNLSANKFDGVVHKLKQWVFRNSNAGPVIYGKRIANLIDKYEVFQSIVYNKAALIFLMAQDIIGEKELFSRLQDVLHKYRYRNVTSRVFIDEISRQDARLEKFFSGWIYSRRLPSLTYRVDIGQNPARLTVTQPETDFVFPVQAEIVGARGREWRTLLISEKEQTFEIAAAEPPTAVILHSYHTPVEIERLGD